MYKKTSLLIGFIFWCMTNIGLAQSDSLLSLLQNKIPDTTRIDLLDQIAKEHFGVDLEKAIKFAQQGMELSEEIGDVNRMANALKNIGLGYYYKGDFAKVLEYWQASLEAYEKMGNDKGIANLQSNIGAVYYSKGDNTKAIDYYLQAIRIAEKAEDDFRRATVLQNIGAVYQEIKEYDVAEKYLLEGLTLWEEMDYDKGAATTSLNLGELYFEQNKLTEALAYFRRSRDIFEKLNDPSLPTALIKIGKMDTRLGRYSEAFSVLSQAYTMSEEQDAKVGMALAQNAIAELHLALKSPTLAINAYEKAIELGTAIGVNEDLQESYRGITNAYSMLGDYQKAFEYQEKLLETNSEIYNLDKQEKLASLQLVFDVEKREAQIDLLNADNEIKTQQIARERTFRNFLMATAGFLLLLIGGVTYLYQYSRKTTKIIIQEKNKSDQLLRNILPHETAEELKKYGVVKAKKYDSATVIFTDFVNFTGESEKIEPEVLVHTIDYYFKHFDAIISKYKLEKIKTIGDAYMAAGGLPLKNAASAVDAVNAAAEIIQFTEETFKNPPEGINPFKIRIGINSGPVVAGVVGTTKFQYDIWGDTVNVASRLESNSEPNQINVSHSVYEELKDKFNFIYRGALDVKNKGSIKMYFYS